MSSRVLRLGLDPGKSTGVALFQGTSLLRSEAIEGGAEGFISWWNDNFIEGKVQEVVSERFVPEVGLGGMSQAYSLQIEGALMALWDGPLTMQLRSQKATLFRQKKDGKAGEAERREWLASKGLHFETTHAMDAATHVLVERKNARDMDFWRRYWK